MKDVNDAIEHRARADMCECVQLSGEEWRDWLDSFLALQSDNRRLRKSIKSAPHQMGCHSLRDGMTALTIGNLGDCDCWKREALETTDGS